MMGAITAWVPHVARDGQPDHAPPESDADHVVVGAGRLPDRLQVRARPGCNAVMGDFDASRATKHDAGADRGSPRRAGHRLRASNDWRSPSTRFFTPAQARRRAVRLRRIPAQGARLSRWRGQGPQGRLRCLNRWNLGTKAGSAREGGGPTRGPPCQDSDGPGREQLEVAHHMRLVRVAGVRGQMRPVDRITRVDGFQELLEPRETRTRPGEPLRSG